MTFVTRQDSGLREALIVSLSVPSTDLSAPRQKSGGNEQEQNKQMRREADYDLVAAETWFVGRVGVNSVSDASMTRMHDSVP